MAEKKDKGDNDATTRDGLRETLADLLDNMPKDVHPQTRDHINAALDLNGGRNRDK